MAVPMRQLTVLREALKELERGDGLYYITQESAFAPGIVKDWPETIPHPTSKYGRLVKRQWKAQQALGEEGT